MLGNDPQMIFELDACNSLMEEFKQRKQARAKLIKEVSNERRTDYQKSMTSRFESSGDQLQALRDRIQKRKELILLAQTEHEKILKLADRTMKKLDNELEKGECIHQKLNNCSSQIESYRKDLLNKYLSMAATLEQKQTINSKHCDSFQESFAAFSSKVSLFEERIIQLLASDSDLKKLDLEIDNGLNELILHLKNVTSKQSQIDEKLDKVQDEITKSELNELIDAITSGKIMSDPIIQEKFFRKLDIDMSLKIADKLVGKGSRKVADKASHVQAEVKEACLRIQDKIMNLSDEAIAKIKEFGSRLKTFFAETFLQILKSIWQQILDAGIDIQIALGLVTAILIRSLIFRHPYVSLVFGIYLILIHADI